MNTPEFHSPVHHRTGKTFADSPVPAILVLVLIWMSSAVLLTLSVLSQRDFTILRKGDAAPFSIWALIDFSYIDKALRYEEGRYDFAILDIHAEATGEKYAVAHAYDGKINIIFGTHTHVQTADEQILPRGTGYITDVGMCGESGGILGLDTESTVERMRTHISSKYKAASGAPFANCALFTLDTSSGRVTNIERFTF